MTDQPNNGKSPDRNRMTASIESGEEWDGKERRKLIKDNKLSYGNEVIYYRFLTLVVQNNMGRTVICPGCPKYNMVNVVCMPERRSINRAFDCYPSGQLHEASGKCPECGGLKWTHYGDCSKVNQPLKDNSTESGGE